MSGVESVSSAGLNSLSGFAFQIKVFVLMMAQLKKGQFVEFETLDDVVIREIPYSNKIHDSCIKLQKMEDGKAVAIQVKQTRITDSVARKVLYNWLLAKHSHPSIRGFELVLDDSYENSSKVFSTPSEKEFSRIMDSDQSKNALVTRLKEVYRDRPAAFKEDLDYIFGNLTIHSIPNIDFQIAEKLCLPFHSIMSDAVKPHFANRIKELFIRVCARIIECAEKRIPYICSCEEYLQLCEEICKNISEDQYNPDYDSLKTVYMSDEIEESVRNSREYIQLGYCRLTESNRIEHLRWEQYYQNIRQHYLTDAKKGQIKRIEDVAYRNFTDVVIGLQDEGSDTPRKRLVQTKVKPISTLSDEYSRWGTYIFLTRRGSEQLISWKDEEDENDG